jgi:hypothetical protein
MPTLIAAPAHASPEAPAAETREFYQRSLSLLERAGIPFLIGGGYAMAHYTGIVRQAKDLDLFCRPLDRDRVLDVLSEEGGYRTDLTWPHFLAKAMHGEAFIDVIYRSGNGLCDVDDAWFAHASSGEVWGQRVSICPIEETLWSKAYVQERDRFDGADVAHLILRRGESIDWRRLVGRFAADGAERVLLAHLILFGFIYPSERERVPEWVVEELQEAVRGETATDEKVCRGTLLSKYMYVTPVDCWGFEDVRLAPRGILTAEDVAHFVAV